MGPLLSLPADTQSQTMIRSAVGIATAKRTQPRIRAISLLADGGFDGPHNPFTLYRIEFSTNMGRISAMKSQGRRPKSGFANSID